MSPYKCVMSFAAENYITRSIVSVILSNCCECTEAVILQRKLSEA